jgi:hypothetical protein
MTTPPNQFTSLDQAAIFILGRLEGIAGSSRHNLEYEVTTELAEISQLLKEQVKHFTDLKEKETQ